VHPGFDLEIVEAPRLQIGRGLPLRDVRFLRRQLRLDPRLADLESLPLDVESILEVGNRALLISRRLDSTESRFFRSSTCPCFCFTSSDETRPSFSSCLFAWRSRSACL
jgi:hypothetical protein